MVNAIRPELVQHSASRAAEPARVSNAQFSELLLGRTRAAQASRANARIVEARHTPLSGEQAASALSQAYQAVTGQRPSAATAAVLTAQWAHETGRGASMYNYNFGGIKGSGPSGLSVAQRTKEGSGAGEYEIVDRFRAYGSPAEGARDYVQLLKNHFPKALAAAERGDSEGFVHALKARGYFTGDESAYVRSVGAMTRQALAQGFDAIGGSGRTGGEARVSSSDGVAGDDERGFDLLASSLEQGAEAAPTPFIDAMRIADEISRAALRIAASDSSEKDRG